MMCLVGETKKVGIEVINNNSNDFIIEGADYSVISRDGTEITKGVATVEGHKILTLFSANQIGRFEVIFTYRIGPEILKAKIPVEVNK